MKSTPSPTLSRYLGQRPAPDAPLNPAAHLATGADHVTAHDLAALPGLLPQVRRKAAVITDSDRLVRRIRLLADYIAEAPAADGAARREIAFALYYFLKGFDLIPDSMPGIGLLDDALLVEAALRRNEHVLRAHWVARGRTWPEEP